MIYDRGMEHLPVPPDIADCVNDLQDRLNRLCTQHLDGCNSVYSVGFYRVAQPEFSSFQRSLSLQEGIRDFFQEFLSGPMGGFVLVDDNKGDILSSIGAIPPTDLDLMGVFSAPVLDALSPLRPSVFSLTDEAQLMFEERLHPIAMSISQLALSIRGCWFIMMGAWSD